MISVQVAHVDHDQKYWELIRRLEDEAVHVDIGIHPVSGEEMVMIASTHEFGTVINHPGGTPFVISDDPKWADVPAAAPLSDGGYMVFRQKGKPGMGVTQPHAIEIPARSFIRSTMDDNRAAYDKLMKSMWEQIIEGKISIQQALALVGNKVEADIKAKIVAIKDPPNAESTKRQKKGVDNPLIDTGSMLGSVRYAVKNVHETIVEMGPGE